MKTKKSKIKELKKEKILILGFGREGKDSYFALRRLFPRKTLGIADKRKMEDLEKRDRAVLESDKGLSIHLGEDYLMSLKKYSLIIKSPGVSAELIKTFLGKEQKITSQAEIFLENYPGQVIGVTGTKGKGTTVSLIYQILKKAGFNVQAGGNIGRPVLQSLLRAKKNDIFVYEMSSHQLKGLKKSPHIAVFLNLFPAHLNFFKNFQDYKRAKENIALSQTKKDFFVYNSGFKELKVLAKKTKAKKVVFNGSRLKKFQLRRTISQKDIPLMGEFNLLNVMAAVSVAKLYKVADKKIKQAIKSFQPLPHRLEFVRKYKGIRFYNDSLATVPEATIAGIESFKGELKTLILGGQYIPKIDFSLLAKKILERRVKTLIFLPETGGTIYQEILKQAAAKKKARMPKVLFANTMKEAVEMAYKNTGKKGVCLLSPAAPSFNLFSDYKERGNLFKKFVRSYV